MSRPSLKDVASMSGYALRTVKKVMSGDPTVRDKTRKAVLEAAEALSYRPNRAASAIGKQKQTTLAVVYSKTSDVYFSDLEKGFHKCADELFDYGLNLRFFVTNEVTWKAQNDILESLLEQTDINGVIIQPISASKLDNRINALVQHGIPVVTVGSDAPDSKRLCFVGCDAIRSGRIGGQLLASYLGNQGRVCIVSERSDQEQAKRRADGLAARLSEHHPNIELCPFREIGSQTSYSHPLPELLATNSVDGIFCTSGNNTIQAAELLRSLDIAHIPLVGFDLSEASSALLKEGWIQVVLDQKPDIHAYEATKLLFLFLTNGTIPEPIQTLPIYLYTSECLPPSD